MFCRFPAFLQQLHVPLRRESEAENKPGRKRQYFFFKFFFQGLLVLDTNTLVLVTNYIAALLVTTY